MQEILNHIDNLILDIKNLGDDNGFRNVDVKTILTLEILRLELSTAQEFTDFTLKVLNQIMSFTGREYYLYDFPEIYKELEKLKKSLTNYNPNFYSADIGILGHAQEKWYNYFGGSIRYLLEGILHKEGIE